MKFVRLALLGALAGCAPPAAGDAAAAELRLGLPIDCRVGVSCEVQNYVDRDPGPGAKDYRGATRTYQDHSGVDIRLPDMAAQRRGVGVLAAAAGRVARLRDGVADVSVRAGGAGSVAGQECGNGVVVDHGGGWETQYCHLARGSLRVKVGDAVAAGQPIARVGLSGNTEYAHLHLTVRRNGTVVDPFAPGPGPARPLWTAAALDQLAYKAGVVLNAGFASGPVTMEMIEEGGTPAVAGDAPVLVAYVRAIGLEAGDVQSMVLTGAGGEVLAQNSLAPLDRAKAQTMMFVGKKRPAAGWRKGVYSARYVVKRRGTTVLTRDFRLRL